MSNHHVAFFEEQALCASSDPDMWFPERRYPSDATHYRTEESMQAKAICRSCPANPECLEYALRYSGLHGIWAGLDPAERTKLQEARGGRVIPFHTTLPMHGQGWNEGVKIKEV